jgi:hypothetical protein
MKLLQIHIPQHRDSAQKLWRFLMKDELDVGGVVLRTEMEQLPDLTLLENGQVGFSWSGFDAVIDRTPKSEPLFRALEGRAVRITDSLSLLFRDGDVIPGTDRDDECVTLWWQYPPTVLAEGIPKLISPTLSGIQLYKTHAILVLASFVQIKVTW